jgi:hypothetical protein
MRTKTYEFELEIGDDYYRTRYELYTDLLIVRREAEIADVKFADLELIIEGEGFADFCEENGYLKVYWSNYSQENDTLDDGEFDITMSIFLEEYYSEAEKAIIQYIETNYANIISKK